MSLIDTLSDFATTILKPHRSFGPLVAQCTIEETGRDELEVTQHPVEDGATISDHAFKRPVELTIRLGWSDSGIASAGATLARMSDVFSGGSGGGLSYAQAMYGNLVALQASRVPFKIVTAKRTYDNMLITSLVQTTDSKTEHALLAQMVCKQVIIVQTQVISVAPNADQLAPQQTGAVQNQGTVQPSLDSMTNEQLQAKVDAQNQANYEFQVAHDLPITDPV